MKIVGLTGGIGSGKSTVLKMFQKLGAATYSADIEAKKLMNTNKNLIAQIIALFGEKAYVNKQLNASYIAKIVFVDKADAMYILYAVNQRFKKISTQITGVSL